MAEPENQETQNQTQPAPSPASKPAETQVAASQPTPSPPPDPFAQRPEWWPEKLWKAGKPLDSAQEVLKSYSELERKFSQGKKAFKGEYDAELYGKRPEAADKYDHKLAPEALPDDLVLLDEPPPEDFTPESGKRYFVLDDKHPLLRIGRDLAYKAGLSQDEFAGIVAEYVKAEAARLPTEAQEKERRDAEFTKLGEFGRQRIQHLENLLQARLGDRAKPIMALAETAEVVEIIENLMEGAGAPRFEPGGTSPGAAAAVQEQQRLMGDPKFAAAFLDANHPEHSQAMNRMRALSAKTVGDRPLAAAMPARLAG